MDSRRKLRFHLPFPLAFVIFACKKDMAICYPNAKINLGLNVTERRPDGYHNLETVFYPIPLCDTLQIDTVSGKEAPITGDASPNAYATDDYTLCLDGIPVDCDPESNLLVKALRLLRQTHALPHLYLYMDKRIPSGAGLGGGSSDAAFLVKEVNRLCGLGLSDDEMERMVAALGADCPFFVRNRPVFATGIGNVFTPVSLSLSGWHLALVKPDVFVSTKEAYAGIRPRKPETRVTEILCRPVEEWKGRLANDFEEGIFALYPEIADIKERLYACGAAYASMSGSGSSVFGLFRQSPDETGMRQLFPDCFYFQAML